MVPRREKPPHRPKGLLGHAVLLSLTALVVHLTWELVQCPIFFAHGTYDATWRGMLVAGLGDVGITWLIYASVAAVSRRWRWERGPWRTRQWVTLVAAAFIVSAGVEWRGLNAGRWRYTAAMPVITGLGVGLVPVIQMILLTPLLIATTARLLDGRRSSSNA